MITANILQRVLLVKYQNLMGTSFTIEVDNKQYLISAKHIFPEVTKTVIVEIWQHGGWKKLSVSPIFCDDEVDIIAFKLDEPITPQYEIIPSMGGLCLSQDAFFLGFPYGLKTESDELNNKYPFPFVKKCIISAIDIQNTPQTIYLDGHNNKGFSGGPVCFINNKTKKIHVAGVVSSYIFDLDDDKKNKGITENSGIFIAYPIKYIVDFIKKEEKFN